MSNQILISSGAKLRDLDDVIIGTDGVLSSLGFDVPYGVPRLDANGKILVSELPNSVMEFKGVWNAATNTPTLADGVGNAGDVYLCNVAGTVNFGAGPITFAVGDYAVYTGSVWARSSGAVGTVTSVAVSRDGDALAITGSPITSSGTINIGFTGNSTQYINGAGNLVTFPTIISEAQNLVTEVYNETGSTLTKGTIVYINGGHGNLPTVTKAIATSDATSAQTYGVVRSDITTNNNGYVTVIGSLGDLDTQAYAAGTQLYLSGTTAGAWTSTKPQAPVHLVYVGIVVRSHPTQGVVEIRIQNGYELEELHNVQIISPANGNILQYDSATSLWKNVAGTTTNIAEGTNLYFTNARARNAISLTTIGSTGAATYDSATGILNIPNYVDQYVGTVTSVGLSAPTGFSVSGSPVTSSGTLALSFASGYSLPTTLKQSNWDDAYTWVAAFPTQTGNAGKFLTTDGSTLSWATNPLGTVTSVAMTVPTGLSVSGSPITTSGTLAVTFTAGYSIPTDALQTNWNTAYTNRITSATSPLSISSNVISISQASSTTSGYLSSTDWNTFNGKQSALILTTTGSSGASTLVGSTLNIPTYTLAGLGGQPLSTNLTSLSGLTFVSTSFVKMTSAGTFALDTNTYALASALGSYLPLAGGTMTGSIIYSGQLLKDLSVSGRASIIINWAGAGYFGLGPNGTHIIRLDQANPTTGAWENATDVVLQLGTKTVLTDSDIGVTVQAKLTNPITGTGTAPKIARFSGTGTIVDSYITDALGTATVINKDGLNNFSAILSIYPATGTNASILNLDNSGAGSFYIGRSNSAGGSPLTTASSYDTVIGHTGNQNLHLITNSITALKIDGSSNSIFNGSLRLGGSTTAKQFVVNQGTTSGYFLSGEVSGSEISYWYYNTSQIQFSSKSSTRSLVFLTSDVERLTISSGGNVGIGTVSPTLPLQVIKNNDNEWLGQFKNYGVGAYGLTIDLSGSTGSTNGYVFGAYSQTGTGFFIRNNGSVTIGYAAATESKVGIYVSSSFTTRGAFASSALNLYDPTTVGVYSQITFGYEAGRTYAAAYMGYLSTNSTSGGFGDLVFGTRSTYDVQPNERLRILSSGPVLVNTASGVSGGGALQVNGDVNINGNFKINGTIIGGGGGSGVTGSGTSGYITKWTGSSTLGNSSIQDNGVNLTILTTGEAVVRFASGGDSTIIIGGTAAQGVSSGEQYITYQNGTTNTNAWMVGMDDGEDWRFAYGVQGEITDANSLARISQSGNWSLGSIADNGSRLQVYGDLYVSGSSVYAGGVTYSGIQTFNNIVNLNSTTNVAVFQNIIWKGSTSAYDFSMGNGGAGMYILSSYPIDLNAPISQRYGLGYIFQGTTTAYNVLLLNSGNSIDELTILGGIRLSTTTAGLIPPRMTTTQLNALSARGSTYCPNGTTVFDTTINILRTWNGSAWMNLW